MIRRLGLRRWAAWKLVQLAYRIHFPERFERIYITDADSGVVFEAVIVGDTYGCGVVSMYGGAGEVLPAGCRVHWDDDYRPDWLDE